MRPIALLLALCVLTMTAAGQPLAPPAQPQEKQTPPQPPVRRAFDVVIYGATPAGIAAACAAADHGRSVALIEPGDRIGGMMTAGLSHTGFGSRASLGGFFRQYMRKVEQHYVDAHGPDSPQVRDCGGGAVAEPGVALRVFQQMLAERPSVALFTGHEFETAQTQMDEEGRVRVLSLTCWAGGDVHVIFGGRTFIDASYEGDAAVDAGAFTRVGREPMQQQGERLGGRIYFEDGRILPGSTGEGDTAVQASGFRLVLTDRAENRAAIEMPAEYDRAAFAPVVEVLRRGGYTKIFSDDERGYFRIQRLPNGKAEVGDAPGRPMRLSLPGENHAYPDGADATRERIIERHRRHALGLLYFLQNDAEMPAELREDAARWGLCRDEFVESGHVPPRMHVREARRVIGGDLFTERDALMSFRSIRAPLKPDAIAVGDAPLGALAAHAAGPLHPKVAEGAFVYPALPHQIPYGVIVPRGIDNLLVPVCVSATHVGYTCLSVEPVFTALGEAAGLAAHLAMAQEQPMDAVAVETLQAMLHQRGAKTIYAADVEPEGRLFRAVQYFGTRGALHTLHDPAATILPPVALRPGAGHAKAHPLHDVGLNEVVSEELARAWIDLLPTDLLRDMAMRDVRLRANGRMTRGQLLERLMRLVDTAPPAPVIPTVRD